MHELQTIDLDHISLSVRMAGDPADPTIVFLHGFPENNSMWIQQVEYFSNLGYHVLAPDLRGFHLSDKPPLVADYTAHEIGRDINALVAYFDKSAYILVGHDLGGMVAWHLSIVYPERIKKTVIINMPHMLAYRKYGLRRWQQIARSWYVFFFQLPYLPELVGKLSNYRILANSMRGSAMPGTFDEEDLEDLIEAWKYENALTTMINLYRAEARHRFNYEPYNQGRVKNPVQILWGVKDRYLIKELPEWSLEWCDQADLEYFEDASHWIVKEMPGVVNRKIRQFLEQA
ncbi:MAG: alpha/beta fold hydrolase [Bacteroidota bacterium]